MNIPTQPVMVRPYTPGSDTHRAPTDLWGEPSEVQVYGWGPAGMAQSVDGNRRPVTIEVEVLAPAGTTTRPRDLWMLPQGPFEQVGHPQDYSHGPWWGQAGVVVQLNRTEG